MTRFAQWPIVTRSDEETRPSSFHTIANPAARQMSAASARTRVTSDGEMSDATITSTASGGSGASGRAASDDDANSAKARLVAGSILPAVDGSDREKFDVRSRNDRTLFASESD